MKYTVIFFLLLSLARLSYGADEGRTIRVDETKFSKIYPAVWFSPSTGEIAPLREKSEVPPEDKFEIWIEPDDPEFGYNPDRKDKTPKPVGFALAGKGPDFFKKPNIPGNLPLDLKITHLMKENQAQEQPVFYCKAKTSTCLIMITSMDKEERVIQFQWRLLSKEEGVSNKASEPSVAPAPQVQR